MRRHVIRAKHTDLFSAVIPEPAKDRAGPFSCLGRPCFARSADGTDYFSRISILALLRSSATKSPTAAVTFLFFR